MVRAFINISRYLILILAALPFATFTACSQNTEHTYPPNGMIDSLWVSPNADMALFMYSRYNVFPTIFEGKPAILTGSPLPGHHINDINPWDDSDLYFTYKQPNGEWTTPINMPTNDNRADCCAMISGTELFLQKGTDIYTAKFTNNQWSSPQKLPINSDKIDTNPHFDIQTQTLYWASNRNGNFDIWQSKRTKGKWSTPILVPGKVNTKDKEDQPYIHGNEMRFSRANTSGNMVSQYKNGQWQEPEIENLGTLAYHAEPSLSNDGKTAWFVASPQIGKLIFMKSKRDKDGKWLNAKPFSLLEFETR